MIERTGWRIRPVMGMVHERDFLEGLAHKVFCSTVYVRRPEEIEFTSAPDLLHEVFGHILPLMTPKVSKISEVIGKFSLNADDD
jgi:phenylalanine-4-hydroxylase